MLKLLNLSLPLGCQGSLVVAHHGAKMYDNGGRGTPEILFVIHKNKFADRQRLK
jgi:hypothetical protein